jgi:hypothetical protein
MKKFIHELLSMIKPSSLTFGHALLYFVGGSLIGLLSALSFMRTQWENFSPDFFLWTSVITTIFSVILLGFSIWQYLSGKSEKEKSDAQVKIWMEEANGIYKGLGAIYVNSLHSGRGDNTYSSVNDVGMAVYAVAENTKALYQSLYEQRCVTETEYRKQQSEIGQVMHEQRLSQLRAPVAQPVQQ